MLQDLTVSVGTLAPVFATKTLAYTDDCPAGTASITVTPTVVTDGTKMHVQGEAVASGATSAAIDLKAGAETDISIVCTSADGKTTETYTIKTTEAAALAIMGSPHHVHADPRKFAVTRPSISSHAGGVL